MTNQAQGQMQGQMHGPGQTSGRGHLRGDAGERQMTACLNAAMAEHRALTSCR